MAASVNKAILIGNLGRDPETRTMQSGGQVATFSLATSETWQDKGSGERRERTQWHRVVIYNEHLVTVADRFLRKGAKVYVSGQIETRKYVDQSGAEREITEVVLRPYKGELVMLDGRGDGAAEDRPAAKPAAAASPGRGAGGQNWSAPSGRDRDLDDDIPF